MDNILTFAAAVAGAWVLFQAVAGIAVTVQLLRLRISPPYRDDDATRQLPALTPDQADAVAELEALGFELVEEGLQWVSARPYRVALLAHGTDPAFAGVLFKAWPLGGYPTTFYSFDAQGHVLATLNRLAWTAPLMAGGMEIEDPYADSTASHWQAHRARLQAAVQIPAQEARRRLRDTAIQGFDKLAASGTITAKGQTWYPSVWSALRCAWNWTFVKRKLMRPFVSAATTGTHAATYLARCFEEMEIERRERPARQNVKALVLVASMVVSMLAWGVAFDWTTAVALIVVLFVHECGHALAMRVFGWKDMSMFFVPFVGAMVTGHVRTEVPAWKQMIVLLAGPLPGLLAGAAVLLWWPAAEPMADSVARLATMSLAVNLFNLLPIAPLDGGRLLELALFSRWPRLRFVVAAAGAAALGVLACWTRSPSMFVITLFLAALLPSQWQGALLEVEASRQAAASPSAWLERLCRLVHDRFASYGPARRLGFVQIVATRRQLQHPRAWESAVAVASLVVVWTLSIPAIVQWWPQGEEERLGGRSAAQREFDQAWGDRYYSEEGAATREQLDRMVQALASDDPRRIDAQVWSAQALPQPQRRYAIESVLAIGREGIDETRPRIVREELRDAVRRAKPLEAAEREASLLEVIGWAERVAPEVLAPTIDARLRLAEAVDEQGDESGARTMLIDLMQRASMADDCKCELRNVVRARAWFELSHGHGTQALSIIEGSEGLRRSERDALAIDHAWILLLTDHAAQGLSQMRTASIKPEYVPTLTERLGGAHSREEDVTRPLDLAFALLRNGQEGEAKRVLQKHGEWQCRMARDGDLSRQYGEPWQQQRLRLVEQTARGTCSSPTLTAR